MASPVGPQPVGSVRQGKRRAHDLLCALLCAAVEAQFKELVAADRRARPAHVELVPWSRARRVRRVRRATAWFDGMVAYPTW